MYKSICTREVHRRTANGPPRLACCCNSTAGFCNGLVVYRLDRFVAGSFLISKHFYFKNVQAASNSVRHSNIYSAGLFPRLSDFSIEMKDLPLSCIIIFIHRVHKNFPPFSWTGVTFSSSYFHNKWWSLWWDENYHFLYSQTPAQQFLFW